MHADTNGNSVSFRLSSRQELSDEISKQSAANRLDNVEDAILITESGKMEFLVSLLDNIKSEGHRCLIFSQSRKILDVIQKVLRGRGHKVIRLDGTVTSLVDRERIIKKFSKDHAISAFLLTTQVGGVGLTLTSADRVVIFDPSWNPATDAQAVDRAFRIGQTKDVIIYRLITCGSIEEKIYRRQIFKDSITRQTTGGADNPYRYFTKQELRELFTLDNPRVSNTQEQLQQLHSEQRKSDTSLDEHIAFLHTLPMFGISDHDLMFSQEEATEPADEHDIVISQKVESARQRIALESQVTAMPKDENTAPQFIKPSRTDTSRPMPSRIPPQHNVPHPPPQRPTDMGLIVPHPPPSDTGVIDLTGSDNELEEVKSEVEMGEVDKKPEQVKEEPEQSADEENMNEDEFEEVAVAEEPKRHADEDSEIANENPVEEDISVDEENIENVLEKTMQSLTLEASPRTPLGAPAKRANRYDSPGLMARPGLQPLTLKSPSPALRQALHNTPKQKPTQDGVPQTLEFEEVCPESPSEQQEEVDEAELKHRQKATVKVNDWLEKVNPDVTTTPPTEFGSVAGSSPHDPWVVSDTPVKQSAKKKRRSVCFSRVPRPQLDEEEEVREDVNVIQEELIISPRPETRLLNSSLKSESPGDVLPSMDYDAFANQLKLQGVLDSTRYSEVAPLKQKIAPLDSLEEKCPRDRKLEVIEGSPLVRTGSKNARVIESSDEEESEEFASATSERYVPIEEDEESSHEETNQEEAEEGEGEEESEEDEESEEEEEEELTEEEQERYITLMTNSRKFYKSGMIAQALKLALDALEIFGGDERAQMYALKLKHKLEDTQM